MPVNHRLIHLDMLRGLASLAVVLGHIRGFVLVDFADVANPSSWFVPVYVLGGIGHQAVIAFFALSGFLVGGAALRNILAQNWSFSDYMIARLSRLWTVVLPVLVLTLILDTAGRAIGGGAGYTGAFYSILSSGPSADAPIDHSARTLLANVLFLQTIAAPVYGSNGSLWSLANEFWYYVIFPLAGYALLSSGRAIFRGLSIFVAIMLSTLLPREMTLLGLIWIAGAFAAWLTANENIRHLFVRPTVAGLILTLVVILLVLGFRYRGVGFDLVLGVAWAMALPVLATLSPIGGLYARIATALSEISYTLYASHFPLLSLIYFCAIAPHQWSPDFGALGVGTAMLTATLMLASCLWWCFERNTHYVRTAALRLIAGGNKKSNPVS